MNISRRLEKKRGLTLVEVLVALLCVSFALVSFIGLVIFSIDVFDYAKRLTEATLIGENMMKEIEEGGLIETSYEEGQVEKRKDFFYRKYVTGTMIEGVKEVRLQIFWDRGKRYTEFLFYEREK